VHWPIPPREEEYQIDENMDRQEGQKLEGKDLNG
jgi:hypothetical protein